jgi:hypothetical protein
MAYIINRFNGSQLIVLRDGTVDTSTSVSLVGKNYTGYGEIQNENFLFLLENFSNPNPPATPLSGQLWYNSTESTINVYDGLSWLPVGSAKVASDQPTPSLGALWLKSSTNQLYVHNGDLWNLIGPEAVEGFGETKVSARTILSNTGDRFPVLVTLVNGSVIAIASDTQFTIDPSEISDGFTGVIYKGLNVRSTYNLQGSLIGNSTTATRLETPRKINGVNFDGQQDIIINSSTANKLIPGSYILGNDFNGSGQAIWTIDATPNNSIGKIVARDSLGNFSANTISADVIGNLNGNVDTSSGTSKFNRVEANEFVGAQLTGNSLTTSRFRTARRINGVLFDGSADVTVPADANSLTGTRLAINVVESSLTSVGILNELTVADAGIRVGTELQIFNSGGTQPTIRCPIADRGIAFATYDVSQPMNHAKMTLIPSSVASSLGGFSAPALIPDESGQMNLGTPSIKWDNIYSNNFVGIASSARYADLAEKYISDKFYEFGTVVEFGGKCEITEAKENSKKVAGIISQNPAYLMNSECEGEYALPVALQGRVKCKVVGKIEKGDMLISAGNGYAKSCQEPKMGTVIGKSLEDFDGSEGTIEVVVGRL